MIIAQIMAVRKGRSIQKLAAMSMLMNSTASVVRVTSWAIGSFVIILLSPLRNCDSLIPYHELFSLHLEGQDIFCITHAQIIMQLRVVCTAKASLSFLCGAEG